MQFDKEIVSIIVYSLMDMLMAVIAIIAIRNIWLFKSQLKGKKPVEEVDVANRIQEMHESLSTDHKIVLSWIKQIFKRL